MKIDTAPLIDIGIEENERKQIASGLSRLLADTYTLYIKSHNFHWNVTGPMFPALHKMFEEEYLELAEAVDLIAERIRALDFFAPASYSDFSKMTAIKEETHVPNAEDMVRSLITGHETVTRTAREVFPLADRTNDQATAEILTERMKIHEKTAWMLRSLLEKNESERGESHAAQRRNVSAA